MGTPARSDPQALVAAAREGDRAALARLISLVESAGAQARAVAEAVGPVAGDAYTVGITGAPGAGKSTLTSALVATMRAGALDAAPIERVAVLAIDPSSPFTGGAILGDRVRMGDHALDAGVYIRSMATRGHLGGLALATAEAARVLDAAGYSWILLETVGVGQVEVDVAGAADTTVVVVNPGWGDAVQANKAGLMEIADLFVINKADRPGVAETRRDLEQMLELSAPPGDSEAAWRPAIVETVATSAGGAGELWAAVRRHRHHLESSGALAQRRRRRVTDELRRLLATRLWLRARGSTEGPAFDALRDAVLDRRLDPWAATDELLGTADDEP
jgi:LAO/AO transport system kinase